MTVAVTGHIRQATVSLSPGQTKDLPLKSTLFSQVARAEPLHLRIAALIAREIGAGALKPGDRLPKEQELAAQFNVGRNVVREAVACLRADGLVDSRQGIGIYVLEPQERQSFRIDAPALADPSNVRALFEMRAALEVQAAGLAAVRRSRSQLRDIEAAFQTMVGAEKWSDRAIDADVEFHRRIAMAADNRYILSMLALIAQNMKDTIKAVRTGHSLDVLVATTNSEHENILKAIALGDASAARVAMETHIRGAAQRLGIRL